MASFNWAWRCSFSLVLIIINLNYFKLKKLKQKLSSFNLAHPKAKKVFRGFSYIFSEKMLKFVTGFLVHAYVARYLGPDKFGKLSYIIKTVNVFYTFSLFGVDELIIKHLLDKRFSREDILKTVLRIRLSMSVLGFIILSLFILLSHPEGTEFSLITLFYGLQIFTQAFNLFELDFHSRLTFRPLFWANNISNVFASLLRVFGVLVEMGIPYFVCTYLAGEVLLKSIIQWRLGFKIFAGKYNPDLAKAIIQSSWPHFLAAFVVLVDQRVSFIFIEEFPKGDALGNYSVAVTLVDLWIFLPMAVCSAVFPTIVTAFSDNKKAYEERIQYLADIMVWFALGFCFGVFLTADVIIDVLYGGKYQTAPEIIRWYALITIPMFFNLARVKWMALENHLFDWLKISALALFLNLCFHYLLVPSWGVRGAICGYLLAQILSNLISSILLVSARRANSLFFKTCFLPFKILKQFN